MITQLVCHFLPTSEERLREIRTVFEKNVRNNFISSIHVFVEDSNLESCSWDEAIQLRKLWCDPKVKIIRIFHRMTFQDLFDYANSLSGLVMISNSDIFYDKSLEKLKLVDFSKHAVCLSRIDVIDNECKLFHHDTNELGGQDSWVFQVPIKKMNVNFFLGVPRCDRRLAWEFNNIGLSPINPINDINSFHFHISAVRSYGDNKVIGPGLFLKFSKL